MDLHDRLEPVLAVARAHAAEVDRDGRFPDEAIAALRESGLMGLTLPTEVGGLGGGPHELIAALDAIAGACGSTAMITLMHFAACAPLSASPPSGHPGILGDMASGRALGTLAFSEAGSRSHFWAPVSRPEAEAAGLRVSAKKSWVTAAGHADVYVVSTQTPDGAGVDLYAIPAGTPGVDVAGTFTGLGFRGNASSPMTFELMLDDRSRLGASGAGTDLMLSVVLPWFNLGNASVSLGLSRAAVEAAITHTTGARLQHLDQTLSALPTIRAQLAKMSIDLEATRFISRPGGGTGHATAGRYTSVRARQQGGGKRCRVEDHGCGDARLRRCRVLAPPAGRAILPRCTRGPRDGAHGGRAVRVLWSSDHGQAPVRPPDRAGESNR